jgi:glycolate dehydrogenase FAD-binding subunit
LTKRPTVLKSMPFDLSLRDALGERLRVLPDQCAQYDVSGVVPKSVALPSNADEAALAMRAASAEGAVIVLRGAGTKSQRPPAPRAVDVVLASTKCATAIEHAAADLTVTVGAGATLAALERALSKAGQWWPCDAPFGESATVGGTIAANAQGALRLRYGAIRDLLLGARIVTVDGTIARAGARVVKSVAGYDLHKLLIGSWGTLALIVEATFKTAPLPETEKGVVARFADAASACQAAIAIARSNLFPSAVTLHDEPSARRVGALLAYAARKRWLLVARCGGNRRSVARQLDGIATLCRAAGGEESADIDGAAIARAWTTIRELAGGIQYPHSRYLTVKFSSLPTDAAAVLEAARAAWPEAELTAHPCVGVAFAHVPADSDAFDGAGVVDAISRFSQSGWTAAVTAAPAHACTKLPAPPSNFVPVKLTRAVKAAFDPDGALDPGRLPGGV